MGISKYPSYVSMPPLARPYPPILDFLERRFPRVGRAVWEKRIRQGKVLDEAGLPISAETPYAPQKKLSYFREVEQEPLIPLKEQILFQSDELLVACKPPFLPVTPAGPYVEECLLNRLRRKTGNGRLVPLHRIDRETAGLVLFSANPDTRGLYGSLFLTGRIEKTYEALAEVEQCPQARNWTVENRLVDDEIWFRSRVVAGEINARSRIELLNCRDNRAHFRLHPITGKKHQLRVHMSGLGFPILNDRFYPQLLPKQEDDPGKPLQLIARRLTFSDPVSGRDLEFTSARELLGG